MTSVEYVRFLKTLLDLTTSTEGGKRDWRWSKEVEEPDVSQENHWAMRRETVMARQVSECQLKSNPVVGLI